MLERVLELARGELGVKESPSGSNRVKYNADYYGREVSGSSYPWCCAFLWWLFREAGLGELFYGGGRTASCGALARFAQANGLYVEADYRPGDLVFMRFSGRTIQHVGILERVEAGGVLVTIEGNTGSGSDADGGQVQRRRRQRGCVVGAYRPAYEEETMTQQQFNAMMDQWLQTRAQEEPGEFSAQARAWAEETGLLLGDAAGRKQYRSFCTREQLMIFLHRFAEQLGK